MINRRIATGLMSIVGALTIAGGATFAYFTDSATSTANAFTAGTLNIEVDQTGIQTSPVTTNWAPGDDTPVQFNIKNVGTLPVNLEGGAVGNWTDVENPEASSVKVTKVEFYNGTDWETVVNSSSGITHSFYYSPDGSINSLKVLAPGATLPVRVTVSFDKNISDVKYQGKTFSATLTVHAKQTNAPTF